MSPRQRVILVTAICCVIVLSLLAAYRTGYENGVNAVYQSIPANSPVRLSCYWIEVTMNGAVCVKH